MKRRLRTLAVFLFLGAIVNVAVAWACAYLAPFPDGALVSSRKTFVLARYPDEIHRETEQRQTQQRIHRLSFELWIDTSGLPLHSMSSRAFASPMWSGGFGGGLAIGPLVDAQRDGIPLDLSPNASVVFGSRQLPLRPIWPGFVINTVLYAVVLWLLFAWPIALRRRSRMRRGLCPKCAYDLRGTTGGTCPECGAPVPS